MKQCVLLFLRTDDELLLAMKKRGFGAGRWNGTGGKLEPGETYRQAAIRECQEEIGVTPTTFKKVAELDFRFVDTTLDTHAEVFMTTSWQGNPIESEEMAPQWFSMDALPYEQMWQDDSVWLPLILRGNKLRCTFTFDKYDNMRSGTLDVVDSLA